ncbi:hypothetical protein [uncultured Pontibacter sp.]|uniref:hypothetical protein n=1 Tax=uncultured Pontibacter sp. TaxID=453356 RepID=UPI002616DAA0|nr:hypothetical protein [uncultured Pontibacter sp.]
MDTLFQTRVYVPGRSKPDLFPYGLLSLLCGLILYVLMPDEWFSVPFILICAGLLYFQRYYFDSGKQELYGYLGRYLTLKSDCIFIDGMKYPIEEIENLEIDINDYDGMERLSAYTVSTVRGVNNFVRFKYQGKKYEFPFYLGSANHQKDLKALVQTFSKDQHHLKLITCKS